MIDILNKAQVLKDKKIILGVCGSISIYKAIEVMRILQKSGAIVRVVMSDGAREFISPIVFESLSSYPVLTKDTQNWGNKPLNHIEICQWGDIFLIAPISANSINKIANGFADNILLESFLAFNGKKLIAPSANTNMINNPITQESISKLIRLGVEIIESQSKELVCKTFGSGALSDVLEIAYRTVRKLLTDAYWINKCVCITSGGSKEKIDQVRYISNFSSGKMGGSLALYSYFLGADVTLIGDCPYVLPFDINFIDAKSTIDYLEGIQKWQDVTNNRRDSFLFMCAAISDYIPTNTSNTKLKKSDIGKYWKLQLEENIDILQTIKNSQKTIGFKLESSDGICSAKEALLAKKLDAVCLNEISVHNPLNSDDNIVTFITKDNEIRFNKMDKLSLAFNILNEAAKI